MINSLLCSHCKRPINGKYFKDYWGNCYHWEHMNNAPSCNYCGRLISRELTKGGTSYSDGRRICMLCHKTAVETREKGEKILKRVHDELELLGIEISPFKPRFYLLDRSRLKGLSGSSETQGFARYQRETINGQLKSFNLEIYILKGLPESSFMSACAHELMHIWFYSRNITKIQSRLVEGSCNFSAYLVMKNQKSPETAYRIHELMENKSPVYGKGFQKIYKMVESKGISNWLKYLESHKK